MVEVKGKAGITAKILADSISPQGVRLLTFEICYPRLVLAELNTHAMLAKNSFSSRAVPFEKMLNQLTGRPVRFGANQAGMQDKGEDFDAPIIIHSPEGEDYSFDPLEFWEMAKHDAIWYAKAYKEAGYHKQVYNRLLEAFQMMKTVLSATELDNFWWLRDHSAADPTLAELARCMRESSEQSTPKLLQPGEWHLPYMCASRSVATGELLYYDEEDNPHDNTPLHVYYSLEEAIKVSCARCAAVSYRNEGYGLEKSLQIYEDLVGGDRKHASAFEHCATPIADRIADFERGRFLNTPGQPNTWEPGISHMDRDENLWSGKFKGWIQFRKLIPGENYTKPKEQA